MPRSLQGRRTGGKAVRPAQVRRQRAQGGALFASCWRTNSAARLIGLPVTVTVPRLKGIRWRFCSRWDEQPAAELGKSFLRLGICRIEDWSGSAVDFIERGFRCFAKANGADEAKRVWAGELRIADYLYPLSEPERNQMEADAEGSIEKLFLIGEYQAAASIPIGATLADLEREHRLLPAAFGKKLASAEATLAANTDTAVWVKESFEDAQKEVYIAPIGTGDGPFTLTAAYKANARKVAKERIALAGARLANVLNAELK
jgi:hypothetical protein